MELKLNKKPQSTIKWEDIEYGDVIEYSDINDQSIPHWYGIKCQDTTGYEVKEYIMDLDNFELYEVDETQLKLLVFHRVLNCTMVENED